MGPVPQTAPRRRHTGQSVCAHPPSASRPSHSKTGKHASITPRAEQRWSGRNDAKSVDSEASPQQQKWATTHRAAQKGEHFVGARPAALRGARAAPARSNGVRRTGWGCGAVRRRRRRSAQPRALPARLTLRRRGSPCRGPALVRPQAGIWGPGQR